MKKETTRKNRGKEFYLEATKQLVDLCWNKKETVTEDRLCQLFRQVDENLGFEPKEGNYSYYAVRDRLKLALGSLLEVSQGRREIKSSKTQRDTVLVYCIVHKDGIDEPQILSAVESGFSRGSISRDSRQEQPGHQVYKKALLDKAEKLANGGKKSFDALFKELKKDTLPPEKMKQTIEDFWTVLQAVRVMKDQCISLSEMQKLWKGEKTFTLHMLGKIRDQLDNYGVKIRFSVKGKYITILEATTLSLNLDELYNKLYGNHLPTQGGANLKERISHGTPRVIDLKWETKYTLFVVGGVLHEVGRAVDLNDIAKYLRENNFKSVIVGKQDLVRLLKIMPDVFNLALDGNRVSLQNGEESWNLVSSRCNPFKESLELYLAFQSNAEEKLARIKKDFPKSGIDNEDFKNIVTVRLDHSYHSFKLMARLFWEMKPCMIVGQHELENKLDNQIKREFKTLDNFDHYDIVGYDTPQYKNTRQLYRFEESIM